MTETQPYDDSLLAKNIYQEIIRGNFGSKIRVVPVVSLDIIKDIRASKVKDVDYRAKTESEDGFVTVFRGLAFDSENVRSQAVALYENDKPVGVMTFIIAPKKWVIKKRYFEKSEGGAFVRDFETVSGNGMPDFMVIPAWTKVDPKHLLHFAVPGFRVFRNAITQIVKNAPDNTWMEVVAQGQNPYDQNKKDKLLAITERGTGIFIPENELPFDIDLIGKNSQGSSSSVKMARMMGLVQIQDLGSVPSLGPVFAKKIR